MMARVVKARQGGFTVIELMVAGFTGALLLSVIMAIMFETLAMAESIYGQLRMNQEGRAMFTILANGGRGVDGSNNQQTVQGVRGTLQATLTGSNYRSGYQLQLSETVGGTAYSITSQSLGAGLSVACTAVGTPVSGCTGNGAPSAGITVTGYLSQDPTVTMLDDTIDSSLDNRLAMFSLSLVDPVVYNRNKMVADDYSMSFYIMVGLNREE